MLGDLETKKRDMRLKVWGLIVVLASGGWTFYKWRDDRAIDEKHRIQELNRFVFEKQTNLYFDAAQAASTIATSTDENAKATAKNKFYQMYFGGMVIVEDRKVELAMIQFGRCMNMQPNKCDRSVTTDQDGKQFSTEKIASLPNQHSKTSLWNSALASDHLSRLTVG
jgi:hypothetical protein